MLLAHHCIFGFYGFWLPNDPRGSGSDYVASYELLRYGSATKTKGRRSVASAPHDRQKRLAAKKALQYPPVEITGLQALTIYQGFQQTIAEAGYRLHALAILPDHIHAVLGWHPRHIRLIVGHLKAKATATLREAHLWSDRPLWGEHGWNVRLCRVACVERAICYTNQNPIKEGKPPQLWSAVVPFDLKQVAADRSAAARAAKPIEKKRRLGGAAARSHRERVKREIELERYLRSKPDTEWFG